VTFPYECYNGSERTAFAAAGIFLELNGYRLEAAEPDAVGAVLAMFKGGLNADGFSKWLRISSQKV
jgi:death-on-curing protein